MGVALFIIHVQIKPALSNMLHQHEYPNCEPLATINHELKSIEATVFFSISRWDFHGFSLIKHP